MIECRLRGHILGQVGNGVALDGHAGGGPGEAGGCCGVDASRMVDEIWGKGGILDLGIGELTGELVDDSPHHFQMPEFFCAY